MDPRDLKSASTYVNNLLAARGLLRGLPIDFAKPTRDAEIPARIINLVHELIQRRDREAEQRETLALSIRTLRNNETKANTTIETLRTRISDLERKNALLEAQSRIHNSSLRTIESTTKTLRDETARLKTTLAQVRTQHAIDLRKRDLQIQKAKERLLDKRRRQHAGMGHIDVKGGHGNSKLDNSIGDNGSPGDLAQDTTDFLTTLSQNLADENDNLLALLRQCLTTLRAVQGLPDDPSHHDPTDHEAEEFPVIARPGNYDTLSLELDTVMQSLQDLLNQPNYVPVEELAERDEEIVQLKQKNETLQQEWKKAIDLVDGWNKTLKETNDELKAATRGKAARGLVDESLQGEGNVLQERGENTGPEVEMEDDGRKPERRRSLRHKEKEREKIRSPKPTGVTKRKRKSTRRKESLMVQLE